MFYVTYCAAIIHKQSNNRLNQLAVISSVELD